MEEDKKIVILENILKTVPLALRPLLKVYSPTEVRTLRGLADRIPWRKLGLDFVIDKYGISEYGIALSYNCDDMVDTYIHEAVHIYRAVRGLDKELWEGQHWTSKQEYDAVDEQHTELMTDYFKDFTSVKKVAQKRLVERLGELDL